MISTAPDDIDPASAAQDAEASAFAAAGVFGAHLSATTEFGTLLTALEAMHADPAAGLAIAAYRDREAELRVEAAMQVLSDEQAASLESALDAMYAVPSVRAYASSLAAFGDVCRETAAIVSAAIGIDFAANSRASGCCGG